MKFDLGSKIIECLKNNSGKRLTSREIADYIVKRYPEDCKEKESNSKQKNISIETQLTEEMDFCVKRINSDPKIIYKINITKNTPREYFI